MYVRNLRKPSANKNVYPQVNAIVNFKLKEILYLVKAKKSKGLEKIYDLEIIKMIEDFQKHPKSFQKKAVNKIPDGSPIGSNH